MPRDRLLPSDPVRFIQDGIRRSHVLWTFHVNMRLAGRFIPRESILGAVEALELVEAYPDDKYLPSYLVLGQAGADAFHVQETQAMKCAVCGGELRTAMTDLPFKVNDTTIVIVKGFPILQCANCPEYLIDDEVLRRVDEVLRRVDEILARVERRTELEIVRYAA